MCYTAIAYDTKGYNVGSRKEIIYQSLDRIREWCRGYLHLVPTGKVKVYSDQKLVNYYRSGKYRKSHRVHIMTITREGEVYLGYRKH